ncbi:hypothetical protein [uncultured Pelagimonas sp.]|uniref:hypothetical protein n=1 Tax=uncultured Pelagimonas sp. TaxID=1618102 RepID=UPI00261EC640|nr:hypothetical protein [uncultured Pelagimonas sp.]
MIKAVLAIAVLAASSALACEDNIGVVLTAQKPAAPEAVIVLPDIPLAQPFSARIKLCHGGFVTKLNVDAIMPAHQHGMNYVPTITDLGAGNHQVDGLVFHMPGIWEFQVEVTQGAEVNRYTHSVTIR